MTSIPGVDYAWSHPSPASLKAAAKQFACRYLSGDASKNLTSAEAQALAAVGISSVVVWENAANRALAGKAAGATDATKAAAQAAACGMPDTRPIYFAVDFAATAAQQTAINTYLDGAASIIGRDRVGIYGGYYPVKRTLDAGKATWAWQTMAWSGGRWDARAVIRQGAQTSIGGVTVDLNTATADDFGQWTPGEDMAFSDADKKWMTDWMTNTLVPLVTKKVLAEIVGPNGLWFDDVVPAVGPPLNNGDYFGPDGKTPANTTWTAKYALGTTATSARQAVALLGEVKAQLAGLDVAALQAALAAKIEGLQVEITVNDPKVG